MNRLARERSPYLLQHAHNPVDWFAWGDEAFAKARAEDKPIFLSIGYSTCHWCHVMERESFENDSVAAALNEHFVSIKVDREERPDVDRVYMTFVQATTGSGGWPMSVWLTPDLKPFYGGTYFPPSSRWGRPGFVDILQEITRVWHGERAKVVQSADALTLQLTNLERASTAPSVPGPDALAKTVTQFREAFDARTGGFGDAPKFPRPSELLFLFREHARTGETDAREMALRTLRAMALGGMRDHIGGGFHRYSVDAHWRVPHFEKMLYDQAQLTLAYLEAAQISGDPFYAEVAEDTLLYARREMTGEGGGFYSAEDADSVPPEHAGDPSAHTAEGAFYLWRADEIDRLLGGDAEIFKLRFGIEPAGNAPIDPQQEFTGKNLLYVARSVDDLAQHVGKRAAEIVETLNRSRVRVFEARVGRARPHLDDKVLTAWNGLMIGAFARGARVLRAVGADAGDAGEPYLQAARQAAGFMRDRMWNAATRTLLRRYRDGHAEIEAYAEDYAFLIFGLLELFQTDADPAWLEWAIALQRRQDELFWDEADAGWFSTTGQDASVLLRMKEDYDGAEPTASSMSVLNLIVLSHLVDDRTWTDRIERTLRFFGSRLEQLGRAVPMMAAALSVYTAGVQQIVIVGEAGRNELERAVARHYLPFAVALSGTAERFRALAEQAPALAAMQPIGGHAAAYVCRNFTCQRPVTTVADVEGVLYGRQDGQLT
ncbi:MAG: thioredoxin domain-containing protein [Acidobacteria bacterium]|nr:MAG: thioredoxin domain-containing protein [Acidobacteriota bacterium]